MFVSRSGGGRGLLEWRIRLFGVGAILGMVGIYSEARWMIWCAIVVLVSGFSLRFLAGGGDEELQEEEEPDAT